MTSKCSSSGTRSPCRYWARPEEHRVLGRVQQAVAPGQGGTDLAGPTQDRERDSSAATG